MSFLPIIFGSDKFNCCAAFDLDNGYVYQTEDRYKGLFYRFIPNKFQKLENGGKLQALSFIDWRGINTSNWNKDNIKIGKKYRAKWIELENVDSDKDSNGYYHIDYNGTTYEHVYYQTTPDQRVFWGSEDTFTIDWMFNTYEEPIINYSTYVFNIHWLLANS